MWLKSIPLLLWFCLSSSFGWAEDYSFDLDQFEKKTLSWGGYVELKGEHNRLNTDGAFGLLGLYDKPRSELDRFTVTAQLDGNLNRGMVDFNWLLQAFGQDDQLETHKELNVFSAYASIKPTPSVTFELGKKTFKWGKGYAWNPVAFVDRVKDPNNPEEALEGYIAAGIDLIKSTSGDLQTLAFTGVALPVYEDINDDFGEPDHLNFAAKLYLLYRDTDIDFLFFSGDSRSTRFGVDLAKNLTSNFEVHAEFAYVPQQRTRYLASTGQLATREEAASSYLLGLRYLSENDITTIFEYYHSDAGYSEAEMQRFYQSVATASSHYLATGDDSLLRNAQRISKSGYARPQIGRDYLYLRVTQKEPFELLYFTPGLTGILNLTDHSYSVSPELLYTGLTNWQFRLRYTQLVGSRWSEYGEKLNENKLELRVRYYF